MDKISPSNVTNALSLLNEAAATHQEGINAKHTDRQEDSDTENDSRCPIFDRFFNNGGSRAILNMTVVTPNKVEQIWIAIESKINTSFR